jgi:type VI secretion system protein ImpM
MTAAALNAPGWYGKLPTLGDFASRRLPPGFIEPWDAWLARGLARLREQQPEAWLDAYLGSPAWRFVLQPGACGPAQTQALAGVLMPSVDRVGRYFPLTIAAPLPHAPATSGEIEGLLNWLHQLDDLAADALHDDWTLEQLDDALTRVSWQAPLDAPPSLAAHAPAALAALATVQGGQASHALLPHATRGDLGRLLAEPLAPRLSLWLAEPADGDARCVVAHGLPEGTGFALLFNPGTAPPY